MNELNIKEFASMVVQTLICGKDKFKDASAAKAWAKDHGFKSANVDETEDSFRLRQREPGDFMDTSFRTIAVTGGVKAVVGKLKDSMMMEHSLPETKSINGVEIFAAGKWNNDPYTVEDLDEMVRAFNETSATVRPYLKLGHDANQKIAQRDGMPAVGWVTNLRRVGEKLVADFKNVPGKVYDLIVGGAYRKVSSEIWWNVSLVGKKYSRALKAVALLGADTPAVQTLNDIISFYASLGEVKSYEIGDGDVHEHALEINKKQEDNSMDELTKVKDQLAESQKNLTEAQKKVTEQTETIGKITIERDNLVKENAALKADKGALEAKVAEHAAAERKVKVEADVNKLIEGKKILPAQKDHAVAILTAALEKPSEKKFSLNSKEVTEYDYHLAFMSQGSVNVNTEESSEAGERQNADLDSKVKKYIEDQKKAGKEVSYKDALIAVSPKEGTSAPSKGE